MALFRFKKFAVDDSNCAMKIGTDGVILGAWSQCEDAHTILDIGCGSGLITLMLAQRCNAEITAVDIDVLACGDARANFATSQWARRLRVIETSFESYKPHALFDLIVSNPPFFGNGQLSPESGRATARHEATLNFESLICYAAEYLTDSGRLEFIYQSGRDDEIIYNAEMKHLKLRRISYLHQTPNHPCIRTLYSFSRIDGPIKRSLITIKENDNYTDEFREYCKDYYLYL